MEPINKEALILKISKVLVYLGGFSHNQHNEIVRSLIIDDKFNFLDFKTLITQPESCFSYLFIV